MRPRDQHTTRTAAGLLAAVALALTGCGGDEPGTEAGGATEGDVLASPSPAAEESDAVGAYDQEFQDELAAPSGQEVTLTAEVDHVISPEALAVGDPDDQTLDPLLVVHDLDLTDLGEGRLVEVTGTVQEGFDVAAAEEEVGVELDDAAFENDLAEPWLHATEVTAVPEP